MKENREIPSGPVLVVPVDEEETDLPLPEVNVGELEEKLAQEGEQLTGELPKGLGAVPVPPPAGAAEDGWIGRIDGGAEPRKAKNGAKRRKRAILVTVILLAALAAVGIAAYAYAANYFKEHFYNDTWINGRNVSELTVDEVKNEYISTIGRYRLTIREKDGVSEVLTAEQLGWTYDDDGSVDAILASQEPWKWPLSLSKEKIYTVPTERKYDRAKAEQAVRALACLDPANVTEPANAMLNMTSESAVIVPEVEGNQVDPDRLLALVLDALDREETEIDIVADDCYIHPTGFADDENLNRRMVQWNALTSLSITYRFGDHVETVDRETLLQYMSDDGENVSVTTDWVRHLVGTWADKYNTFGRERQFRTHDGAVVTLPAHTIDETEKDAAGNPLTHTSDYGWLLDAEATAQDLTNAITNRESGEREPVFEYRAMGWDNGDLTGSYVEVSIEKQHMWVYKDGAEIISTDVVTGLPEEETMTYPGCYAIDAKKSPAVLGSMDTQGYSSDVEFWAPFDGGRGLHDAPWRGKDFGGKIYLTNGSHGCVNIPSDQMEAVYNAIEIGMAVCVY